MAEGGRSGLDYGLALLPHKVPISDLFDDIRVGEVLEVLE